MQTYEAEMPDGRMVRKRSHHVAAPVAWLLVHEWRYFGRLVAMRVAQRPDDGRNTKDDAYSRARWIEARRIR